MENIVRIDRILINGIKTVLKGDINVNNTLDEDDNYNASILGIYGQNGSGKTSVIDFIKIVKSIFEGKFLPNDIKDYISFEQDYFEGTIDFTINKDYFVSYYLKIGVSDFENNEVSFLKESLKYNQKGKGRTVKKIEINYLEDSDYISPSILNDQMIKLNPKKELGLLLLRERALVKKESLLFSELFSSCDLNVDGNDKVDLNKKVEIIKILQNYAMGNLFVVDKKNDTMMGLNLFIPISFSCEVGSSKHVGKTFLPLDKPVAVPNQIVKITKIVIDQINTVINKIIPDFEIGIENFGKEIIAEGIEGERIQVFSLRSGNKISFAYEAEGIKKIVSIMSLLIAVFNDEKKCLFVDELDAGIFEVLLGDLLEVILTNGKGQLFFTSHNLRPLEVLSKDNIIFTTVNPENRYINLKSRETNNLRNQYLKFLKLGGAKEDMGKEYSISDIRKAFRKAGKIEENYRKVTT